MSRSRIKLVKYLKESLPDMKHFYFSPPSGKQLIYPCLIYQLEGQDVRHADNRKFIVSSRYSLTLIDENPDSKFPKQMEELERCSLNRSFSSDNMNHWSYTIYF